MLKKTELIEVIKGLVPGRTPFDLAVITTSKEIRKRYRPYSSDYTLGYDELKGFHSIAVIVLYTDVAVDYYIRDILIPAVIKTYGKKHAAHDYRMPIKEISAVAGLGKIGKNSLLFNRKFGFNCKIDLVFFRDVFDCCDGKNFKKEELKLEFCRDCNICIESCPMKALDNFKMINWQQCDKYISPQWHTPGKMCRTCITSGPFSNIILKNLYEKGVPKRKQWQNPKRSKSSEDFPFMDFFQGVNLK